MSNKCVDCGVEIDEDEEWCTPCLKADDYEEYTMYDRYQDLTAPGIYDREPDEPGMDYGPDMDDI